MRNLFAKFLVLNLLTMFGVVGGAKALSNPTPSELVRDGFWARASFMQDEIGLTLSRKQEKPFVTSLKNFSKTEDTFEKSRQALADFLDRHGHTLRKDQQKNLKKGLSRNRAEIFGCLKEITFGVLPEGKSSIHDVIDQLESMEDQWANPMSVSSARNHCRKQSAQLRKEKGPSTLRLRQKLKSIEPTQKNMKAIAFLRSLLSPRLVACKEFSVTEVLEVDDKTPFRWGLARCTREDGITWFEGFKGRTGEEYPVYDISESLSQLLGDEPDEQVEEKSNLAISVWESFLRFLSGPDRPPSGSIFSVGGVKYRWSTPDSRDVEISETEHEFINFLITQEAHYSIVRDRRFEDLFGRAAQYEVIHMGFAPPLITSLTRARGFVYENKHKRFFRFGQNFDSLANRYLHKEFKFLPYGDVQVKY